jgi:RHS repeat-associated protein
VVNDAPIAIATQHTASEDTASAIQLTGSDVEGDALTFAVVAGPQHGTLSGTPPQLVYTPATNFHGVDSFSFRANDGSLDSPVAAVEITVVPDNDPPVAFAQTVSTAEDTAKPITLMATDLDGDTLHFEIFNAPSHGTLSGTPPNVTYQPTADFAGADTFSFRVRDVVFTSAVATVSITVTPVNDAPHILGPLLVFPREDERFDFVLTNILSLADVDAGDGVLHVSLVVTNGVLGVDATNGVAVVSGGLDTPAFSLAGTPGALNTALGSLYYLPATNYFGNDTLTLSVSDNGHSGAGTALSSSHVVALSIANANEAAFVYAGQNQFIILPDAATLSGVVLDDGLPEGAPVTAFWQKLTGSGEVTFAGPTSSNTTVTFSAPGNYILRLLAHDTALTNYADVTFVVKAEGMNAAPNVNAGPDLTVGLTNRLQLNAFADDDGLPRGSSLAVQWSKVSGPGEVTFDDPGSAATDVTFSALGTYVLRLAATDSVLTTTDEVFVTVFPHNQPPVVDAGADATITIPDPALLAAGTNTSWSFGRSLLNVDSWNPAISQPGLSLIHNQVSSPTPYVERDGLTFDGTNLFVAGIYYNAANLRVWTLGRWNGTNWSGVRDGHQPVVPGSDDLTGFVVRDSTSRVMEHAARGNELFVIGSSLRDFNGDGAGDSMVRFNGSNWVVWAPQRIQYEGARAVAVTSNAVYYGAFMEVQATNAVRVDRADAFLHSGLPVSHGIAKWDGTNWHLLGSGINGHIASIAVADNGKVYVGGKFMNHVANGVANNIAMWDGTNWYRLGAGLTSCSGCDVEVSALAVSRDGFLYAAGRFAQAGGLPANNIARWDGTNWSSIGQGIQNGVNGNVYALAFHQNALYVGGNFTAAGGFPANKLAKWNGQFWSNLGTNGVIGVDGNPTSASVHALLSTPAGLYVGGAFKALNAHATNIVLREFAVPPAQGIVLNGRVTDDGLPPGAAVTFAWTKVSGPGQVTFENASSASTVATFDQLGTYVLRLTASDSELSASDDITITVQGNLPPVVSAGADQVIDLNETTFLEGMVADDGLPPGSDVVRVWSVVAGPGTATFANVNTTNTTVRFSQAGMYLLRLTANDSHFSSEDDVIITVLGSDNQPPYANARTSPETIAVGQTTTLSAQDLRDDGRPYGVTNILWSQVSGPAPMLFFSPTTAVCQATVTQPGAYRVRVDVNDGELTYSHEYHLNAVAGTPPEPDGNAAPVVSAGPDVQAVAYQRVPLQGTITDDGLPSSGSLRASWTVISAPGRVYFENASMAGTSARFYVPGTYTLRLAGSDGRLAAADEVVVTVAAATNEPPLVIAGADLEVVRPAAARLEALFYDDALPSTAGKTFSWFVESGPAAVAFNPASGTITNGAVISSATFSSTGTYVLRVTVSDSLLTDSDTITVTVRPGTNSPPVVYAGADLIAALPNPAILHTEAVDDGLESGLLQVSWSQVSGPGMAYFSTLNGQYRATFNAPGEYVLRLTASDGTLSAHDDVVVTAYESPEPPLVAITSPQDSDAVTAPRAITGTVQSPILASYTLHYRLKPAGDETLNIEPGTLNSWTLLSTGSASVVNGPLAHFDPTLLLNGIYELQLTATDLAGRVSSTNITVIVDRNMKVGHFTLSFNDLTIPVAGIPIQVIRTYDSRDKRMGDFGVGWTLDIKNIRLQKNRNLGLNWEQAGTSQGLGSYSLFPRRPRTVTITFPDGKTQKFRARSEPESQIFQPITGPTIVYVPEGNTRGTLVSADEGGDEVFTEGTLGAANLFTYDGSTYNPSLFRYTSDEGEVYLIDEREGLKSLTDRNGNTLIVSSNGITWTNSLSAGGEGQGEVSSKSVVFQRDAVGRITNILDAAGHALAYRYDTNGNLVEFVDRVNLTNTFSYNTKHELLTLVDARGIAAARNEYDNAGRLIAQVDAAGNTNHFTHDLNARAEIIRDRLGHITIHEYDENGNITRSIDALGNATRMTYDANDNLLTKVDALGNTNRFTYDARDNKLTETDPLGNTTTYTYNAFNQSTSIRNARGFVTTNIYDASGNLTEERDPLGHRTLYSYDAQGNLLVRTDALGNTMENGYDQFGQLTNTSVRDVNLGVLNTTAFAYDANGNQTNKTTWRTQRAAGLQPAEALVTRYVYDSAQRLVLTVHPDGSTNATVYNAISKPAVNIDALGRHTLMAYDDRGNLTRTTYPDGTFEETFYDAENRRTGMRDKAGRITGYTNDALGRLTITVHPDNTGTTNFYDAIGRVLAASDARGNTTFYGYEENCGCAGRRTTVTNALGQVTISKYDEVGNLVQTIDALGRTNTFVYDELNRRRTVLFPDGTAQGTTYDALSRRIAETDQSFNTTWFGYDALGRLLAVTNQLGHVTRYEYNEQGQQTAQIDAEGRATRYEYDALGRRTKRTLPLNQFETYAYDLAGRLTNRTDFNGRTTTFIHDVMNRLVAKVPDASFTAPAIQFSYNELGLRTNMVDASGVTTYRYDERNRLVEKATPQGTLVYAYNAHGQVTNIASLNANGVRLGYSYDALNRLSEVHDLHAGSTTYGYDAVGNLQGYLYPNGVSTGYEYNQLNRLTNMTVAAGITPLARYSYTLMASGHRTSAAETVQRDPLGQPTTLTRLYHYDRTYRLSNETIGGTSYTSPATLDYTYDKVGNRLRLNSTQPGIVSQMFDYDANDRLTSDTCDDNGNTLVSPSFGMAQPDQYDFENRLVRRTEAGKTVMIVYDGDGNRAKKIVTTSTNTVTTWYLVDTVNLTGYAQVLEELSTLNSQPSTLAVTRTYSYGHDLISQQQFTGSGWQLSFFGYDGHGNTRFLTDANGFVTDTYDYDAFGNLIARIGSTANNYLFTGEQYDPDLGLYFLRARYQNTQTGRFWTMDEWEGKNCDPISLHKYLYTGDDPVNFIDPTGFEFTIFGFQVGNFIQGIFRKIESTRIGKFVFAHKAASAIIGGLGYTAACAIAAKSKAQFLYVEKPHSAGMPLADNADKQQHCYATCFINRCTAFLALPSLGVALAVEIGDIIEGTPTANIAADIRADWHGLLVSYLGDSCYAACLEVPVHGP